MAPLFAAGAFALVLPAAAGAEQPADLLTPFEAKRHDVFVETARSRDIDLLFIGDSAVEFWRAEGKAEWDRSFAGLNAANFGVQGSDTDSVLWRLRNGELDGFEAKAIVLDAMWAGDLTAGASEAEILAANAAIVAEIRKRQPRAKILLVVVPRLRGASIQTALVRKFAELANGSSVQYLDVRRPFIGRDGQFDTAMGSGRGSALSEKGYAAWADAMRPTLSELLADG
jgi:beta-glucosidase